MSSEKIPVDQISVEDPIVEAKPSWKDRIVTAAMWTGATVVPAALVIAPMVAQTKLANMAKETAELNLETAQINNATAHFNAGQ